MAHLFARLPSLGHLDSVLEGGLGQRLLRRHVVGVILGVVEIPSPHGTLLIFGVKLITTSDAHELTPFIVNLANSKMRSHRHLFVAKVHFRVIDLIVAVVHGIVHLLR